MLPMAVIPLLLSFLSIHAALATPLPNAPSSPFPLLEERDTSAGVAFSERAFVEDSSTMIVERDSSSNASDFAPVVLLSVSLPILFPTLGSVFTAGGQGTVTWNATLPAGIEQNQTKSTAQLVLGYTADGILGYNLDLENPLLVDIPLYVAPYSMNFTFPSNLTTRSTYLLALMGSSGNVSPKFTIEGIDSAVAVVPSDTSSVATSTSSSSSATTTSTPPTFALPTATTPFSLPVSTSKSAAATVVVTRTASAMTSSGELAQASAGVATKASSASPRVAGSIVFGFMGAGLAMWLA